MWQTFFGDDSFWPLPCYSAEIIVFWEKLTFVTIDKPSRAIVLTFDNWEIPAYERGFQMVALKWRKYCCHRNPIGSQS